MIALKYSRHLHHTFFILYTTKQLISTKLDLEVITVNELIMKFNKTRRLKNLASKLLCKNYQCSIGETPSNKVALAKSYHPIHKEYKRRWS
jgi:hypothetical protein